MRTLRIAHAALAELAAFFLVAGCASPQRSLQAPVLARCNASGLPGCTELTEGVLLYVNGDVEIARRRIWRASLQSSPQQLNAFATALQELASSSRQDGYWEPVIEVSNLLRMQAASAVPAVPAAPAVAAPPPFAPSSLSGASRRKDPQDATPVSPLARPELPRALTADTDTARLEGGVAAPGTSPAKVPCGALHASGSAYCIKAIGGPFVVTDLKMGSSCPNDMFVAAGSSTTPRWALLGSAASPLSIHGARLSIKEGEFLFVGAQAATPAKISTDARCSVLWSGFRPYTSAAGEPLQVPRDLGF